MLYTFTRDPIFSRLARLEDAIPYQIPGGEYINGGQFSTVPASSVNEQGELDLSNSGIVTTGSISPAASESGFAATATTTSITWYWDGTNGSTVIVVRRADATRQTIPGNSLTITGLTNNTWYGFLPFWTPANVCTIGWVSAAGAVGTPAIAYPGGTGATFANTLTTTQQADARAQQAIQGRESLSVGFMTYKTPNVGTNSGVAEGGGSPGKCIMRGTHVETLGDIPYSRKLYPCTDWWRIVGASGRSLNCTPNHPLYHPERGKVRADELDGWVLTDKGEEKIVEAHPFKRVCVKEEIEMPVGHIFFANGFMSHNYKLVDGAEF